MIKIRVEGEPKDVEKFVRLLEKKDVRVLSESDDYKNRNSVCVRRYLDVDISRQGENKWRRKKQ